MNLEDIINSLDESQKRYSQDIDSENLEAQIEHKLLESERYKSDTKDRKWLAIWTAIIVSIWLASVMFVLIFNEKLLICLSDTVLVTLLGTTTLNVLGLSFIVLRGHFTSSK